MSEEGDTTTAKQNKPPRWRPTKRQALSASRLVLWAAVVVACVVAILMGHRFAYLPLVIVVLLILIRLGYRYEWTGFGETSRPKDEEREVKPRKTLWDWMQLLFVPAMLALLAGGLTWWQTSSERARQAEEALRQEALRAQNASIQAYLDQMTALMLQQNLRESKEDSEVRTIAQARTTTVLQAVDPENQRTLLQFLSDANLTQQGPRGQNGIKKAPIISLDHVNLSDGDLRKLDLSNAVLADAALVEADLGKADLSGAALFLAHLRGSDLRDADLTDAVLVGADLRDVDLRGANLRGALLMDADLRHAWLSDVEALNHADLRGADLRGLSLVIEDEKVLLTIPNAALEARAKSLEGATMPNGQKYEDWLKDKETGGKD